MGIKNPNRIKHCAASVDIYKRGHHGYVSLKLVFTSSAHPRARSCVLSPVNATFFQAKNIHQHLHRPQPSQFSLDLWIDCTSSDGIDKEIPTQTIPHIIKLSGGLLFRRIWLFVPWFIILQYMVFHDLIWIRKQGLQ
ncbi:hypothetical protein BJ165DRAFT_1064507 [Panaeolus papilionaceus]|nr:hypothetical protein BJ165DRAFT_1064507 [Panaeolus papilionaceus]